MNGKPTLDLHNYVPYYIRSIANRLSQIDQRIYRNSLNVGLNEWACLALLAREDGISASRICEVSGYDKAVISRSVRSLMDKGYVSARAVANHNRKQLLSLTAKGKKAYLTIEALVLERERLLLEDVTPAQKKVLLKLLARILDKSQSLLGPEADQLPKP